jgi:FkbM family methyltransferase
MLSTRQKNTLARVAHRAVRGWRHLGGRPMQGVFVRDGLTWELDLNEGIDLAIYLLGKFEPETVRFYSQLIRPGFVVLDIGANIGAHTLPFARLVGPDGRVLAFEPTLSASAKLRRNVALNPGLAPRVEVFHAYCSNPRDAEIPPAIYSSWPLESRANLHDKHLGALQAVGEPQLIVLDELARQRPLDRIDFIKLDVDGNEIKVLHGCREILRRHHPAVIAEIVPYLMAELGHDMEEFWRPFRENGYRMRTLERAKEIPLETKYFEDHYPRYASVNVLLT